MGLSPSEGVRLIQHDELKFKFRFEDSGIGF